MVEMNKKEKNGKEGETKREKKGKDRERKKEGEER